MCSVCAKTGAGENTLIKAARMTNRIITKGDLRRSCRRCALILSRTKLDLGGKQFFSQPARESANLLNADGYRHAHPGKGVVTVNKMMEVLHGCAQTGDARADAATMCSTAPAS